MTRQLGTTILEEGTEKCPVTPLKRMQGDNHMGFAIEEGRYGGALGPAAKVVGVVSTALLALYGVKELIKRWNQDIAEKADEIYSTLLTSPLIEATLPQIQAITMQQ